MIAHETYLASCLTLEPEDEVKRAEESLADREKEISGAEKKVPEREKAVAAVEKGVKENKFDEGIHVVGRDVKASHLPDERPGRNESHWLLLRLADRNQ